MWDHLLEILVLNIAIIVFIFAYILPPFLVQFHPAILFIYLLAGIMLFNVITSAASRFTMEMSDYESPDFRAFFTYMSSYWKQALAGALIMVVSLMVFLFVIPYYFIEGSIISLILGTIVFWAWLTVVAACFYFYPTVFRLNKSILKSIKASFAFFFENILFSLFMVLGIIVILPVSGIFIFLFPGPAGILLWINVCYKIRLYKYAYLEDHPGADRKKIPWAELIREDDKRVGKRTLRGMIFPWKS